jgi:CheY-like chemotaxis protein
LSGITASGNNLVYNMNNIVSYLQIDAKNNNIINAPFNLRETLANIFVEFQVQCNQKNILFSQLISSDLPQFIIGDKIKITTIIQNLLYNSLKFSDKGVIKIELKLLKTSKSQDLTKAVVSISIIDEGRGLNGKNMKDLIFSNLKKNADSDGFGLGLFIVNNFVENLNGSFELTNNEISGCTAKVEFELQVDESNAVKPDYKNDDNNSKNFTILLVDNDITNCITLQKILERKGHKVTLALKGKEVFSLLHSSKFDIILLDVCLPDMNGMELTKLIRLGGEFSPEKNIPIIGLSANADPLEMKDSLAAGMNDYIIKPINVELLFQKMNEFASNTLQETPLINS